MSKIDIEVIKDNVLTEVESWLNDQDDVNKTVICIGLALSEIFIASYPLCDGDWLTDKHQVKTNGDLVRTILMRFNEDRTYAHMGGRTTRSGPVVARNLVDRLNNLSSLSSLNKKQRQVVAYSIQKRLFENIADYFNQQKIVIDFDHSKPFSRIIEDILKKSKEKNVSGPVAQHLVGAKLAIRFPDIVISNHAATTADQQLDRPGDFNVNDTAIHITMAPGSAVVRKCFDNISQGYKPLLIVPHDRFEAAKQLIDNQKGLDRIGLFSLESFVGQNMDELASFKKSINEQLRNLLTEYNKRVAEVETDLSMQVKIPTNV